MIVVLHHCMSNVTYCMIESECIVCDAKSKCNAMGTISHVKQALTCCFKLNLQQLNNSDD